MNQSRDGGAQLVDLRKLGQTLFRRVEVMIIDERVVITRSFNFSGNAEDAGYRPIGAGNAGVIT